MLFWPEISALGVFFNFDNERMHPPKYLSDPPGTNGHSLTIIQGFPLKTHLKIVSDLRFIVGGFPIHHWLIMIHCRVGK